MSLARFKDLCLDAVDPDLLGAFYSELLALTPQTRDGVVVSLDGATPTERVWINRVPEQRSAKNRMHLDIRLRSLEQALELGARELDRLEGWTVLADPEGNEFCVFLTDGAAGSAGPGLMELGVDAVDQEAQSRWWAELLGAGRGTEDDDSYSWIDHIPDAPFESIAFANVPEPKTVKNRVHLDLFGDPAALEAAGAQVLRTPDEGRPWTVMADPEGNEFCVFAEV
jgi:hypothetical protein